MSRKGLLPLLAATFLALALPASASATFSYGVQASEVTDTTAILWAHADSSGPVTVEVATNKSFTPLAMTFNGTASAADDNTVRVNATGLNSNKNYYYRFKMGGDTSAIGSFKAAPSSTAASTIKFAITGDADAEPIPSTTTPFYNNFEIYQAMQKEKNRFNINIGDTIYSDTEVPGGSPPAITLAAKWGKYKQNLALPNLQNLRGSGAMYNHWDDHEFINDFSVPEFGLPLYNDGVQAFQNYMAADYSAGDGLYRTARWGKNLELFFLDERSFRDSKASTNNDCDFTADPGEPDLAPTAPQSTRNQFAALNPALAQPVKATCLPRINDTNRTMLGAAQLAQFKADIAASNARFKVIINEVPIQQFFALPYDRWEGYAAERTDLITYLKNNVKNTVFLTTDSHANMVNDVRFNTLPFPSDSGILEAITGPVGTMTYAKEVDAEVGGPGTAAVVRNLFFKPNPPVGVGMKCASLDVFSYAQVKVASTGLTITPKDENRHLVREPDGKPCGPFKVKYKK